MPVLFTATQMEHKQWRDVWCTLSYWPVFFLLWFLFLFCFYVILCPIDYLLLFSWFLSFFFFPPFFYLVLAHHFVSHLSIISFPPFLLSIIHFPFFSPFPFNYFIFNSLWIFLILAFLCRSFLLSHYLFLLFHTSLLHPFNLVYSFQFFPLIQFFLLPLLPSSLPSHPYIVLFSLTCISSPLTFLSWPVY